MRKVKKIAKTRRVEDAFVGLQKKINKKREGERKRRLRKGKEKTAWENEKGEENNENDTC